MGYEEFLTERRKGIARVIKAGFESIGASPEAQTLGLEEVGASGSFADTYLHPDHPFSNELAVRQLIRQLRGDILWYEQHMDKKALEMLTEELPQNDVDVVRLLSGPANLTSRTKKSFAKFVQEFEHKGILCEWRVLNPGDARLMHARVMFDDGRAFELPPLSSVLAGGVDSIRESDMPREFFEQAWEGDTVALEDYATDT
jgi:hypothetical protein